MQMNLPYKPLYRIAFFRYSIRWRSMFPNVIPSHLPLTCCTEVYKPPVCLFLKKWITFRRNSNFFICVCLLSQQGKTLTEMDLLLQARILPFESRPLLKVFIALGSKQEVEKLSHFGKMVEKYGCTCIQLHFSYNLQKSRKVQI